MNAYHVGLVGIALLMFPGCGSKESSAPASQSPAPSAAAPAIPGVKTIELTAGDNMKFSATTFEAKHGESVRVILKNIGSQPKQVMGHNWILLKANSDVATYANAAITAADKGYQPPALDGQVLARIRLLGPKEIAEVIFNAPQEPGEYPFLCSFPGHSMAGMQGVLVVK